MEFKIGQVVMCTGCYDNDRLDGKIGKIILIRSGTRSGVEFFNKISSGHTCGGRGKDGYCWNINNDYLKPFSSESEEIE